jgi:hypothetical protein
VKPKFAVYVPHTAGRYQKRRFRKALCPIVERCTPGPPLAGRRGPAPPPQQRSGEMLGQHRGCRAALLAAAAPAESTNAPLAG